MSTGRPELVGATPGVRRVGVIGAVTDMARERMSGEATAERRLRLFELGERLAKCGSWAWDPRSGAVDWSPNVYRIFGLDPAVVTPGWDVVLECVINGDRERLAGFLELCREGGSPEPVELRVEPAGGRAVYVEAIVSTLESGAARAGGVVGAFVDVTAQHVSDRKIAVQIATSEALERWENLEIGGQRLLLSIGEAMEFDFGALWVPEGELLAARVVWSSPSVVDAEEFAGATLALRVPRCIKLPGLAWQRRQPVGIIDVLADTEYRRQRAAAAAGLRGAIAFPAVAGGDVLAVLEFHYRDVARPTEVLARTLSAVGRQIGDWLATRWSQVHASPLTGREVQVLQLVADGCSGPEIAERLVVSPTTVRTHMKHIFARLGVDDRAAAVAAGIRLGVIE